MRLKRDVTFTADEVRQALYEWLQNHTEHSPQSEEELDVCFTHVGGDAEIPTLQVTWIEEH